MNVGCAAFVVARQEGVKGGNAVIISGLDAAQGSALEDRGIVGVTHTRIALNTNIHAGGV